MDKFLERDKLPKLKQEQTDNMSDPVSIKGIEFVGKSSYNENSRIK